MFKGIQHTGFITKDIDKCFEFYSSLPGVKVVFPLHVEDGYVIKKLSGYENAKILNFYIQIGGDEISPQSECGAARVEFIQYLEPEGRKVHLENNDGGNAHISIVTDSIEEDCRKFKEMGLELSELVEIEYEEGGLKGVKLVYVKDLDDRLVELMQFPQ